MQEVDPSELDIEHIPEQQEEGAVIQMVSTKTKEVHNTCPTCSVRSAALIATGGWSEYACLACAAVWHFGSAVLLPL